MRSGEVGLALLPILERPAFCQVQFVGALFVDFRLGKLGMRRPLSGDSGNEVVCRLDEFGRFEGEKRRAAFDLVAELGNQAGDSS